MPDRRNGTTNGDDLEVAARDGLATIAAQGDHVARSLSPEPSAMYVLWGAAWSLGATALYLATDGGPGPWWSMTTALIVVGIVVAGASTLSARQGVRAGRGLEGHSTVQGTMYGFSWLLGLGGGVAVAVLLDRATGGVATATVWTASLGLVVALLFVTGGAVWREPVQYGFGIWLLVVTLVALAVGTPHHLAVLAIGGGGGLLATAPIVRRVHGTPATTAP